MWIGLNLVFTFTASGVSWEGHLGGLLGGVVLGAAMVYAPRGERRSLVQWSATAGVLAVSLVVVALRCLALA